MSKKTDISKAAAALGRRGGLKGGPARAASMTPEQRSEVARLGAEATNKKRWGGKKKKD
jgi:general stress protein YciG